VLVLEQTIDDQGMLRVTRLDQVPWYSLDSQLHPSSHLDSILTPSLFCSTSSPLVILKLEDLGIVEREILVRVPGGSPETLQSSISLESGLS
jgi:hypothetical protein